MQGMPILERAAIRQLEAMHAGLPLMERAGQAAARVALRLLAGRSGCVLVLAGPGNNGGDGFVLARHLREHGQEVIVVCPVGEVGMPEDARAARRAWEDAGGQVLDEFVGTHWALVVDALFGVGLSRAPEGKYADWLERLRECTSPVLALDIPSGLDADTGRAPGAVVRATHTATFLALKPGLLTAQGLRCCGEISLHTLDLSAPPDAGRVLGVDAFADLLRPRPVDAHKGLFGQAGVIGGASGMLGAALLAARAALHLGAGRVYPGLLDSDAPTLDVMQPELMLRPASDLHLLCNALAIGPGLGQSELATRQLQRALGFSGPLLLDADALNLLAQSPAFQAALAQRSEASVLTPHPAEAARLLQCSTATVEADRLACARELARRFRAHVVLKGAGSVLVLRDGRWFINRTGNPGLASAGTGDVLCGFVLALLAQGADAGQALCCAVHLHGLAADRLVEAGQGPVGLTASELIVAARGLFNAWTGEREERA